MRVWYLSRESCDYAIVFADTIEEAFEKAEARTGYKKEDWYAWEEFKPGMYGDVLWFY